MRSTATFSPCRRYRYALRRVWNADVPPAMFVGLNPSTADEVKNDPTVRRCIGFALRWGWGGLIMTNIFALRSTDPNALTRVDDPVGPRNDRWLRQLQREAGIVIAAWGVWGELGGRGEKVRALLDAPHCLGVTKCGAPRHPLYLRADLRPVRFA
ncbi:MAG: DUF1643 domain-containing protein [Planctomycetes bacterium]|nr:DUF1643 domain-containing protein [Planctomycetota bacterium]